MKKEQFEGQKRDNEKVSDFVRWVHNQYGSVRHITRLRKCKAWVYEYNSYVLLQSYNTIVAGVVKDTNEQYDFRRMVYGCTATTAQHIAKFFSDYGNGGKRYTWRKV